jgi:hypothetical protein
MALTSGDSSDDQPDDKKDRSDAHRHLRLPGDSDDKSVPP